MSEIIQKTLKEIEDKKIEPKPKWRHSLREYMLWVFFGISIVLGAFATSTIIYILFNRDWSAREYLNKSLFEYILISLPYLWIIILVILVLIAFFQVKNTKGGYKHSPSTVVIFSIILSLIFGIIIFYYFLDFGIHDFFSKNIPIYNSLVCSETAVWNNVGSGLLNGEVIAIKNNQEFTLKDCNGKIWQVYYETSQWNEYIPIMVGIKIKMVGMQEAQNIFIAKIIRPLDRLKRQLFDTN